MDCYLRQAVSADRSGGVVVAIPVGASGFAKGAATGALKPISIPSSTGLHLPQ
jgi:hypothetical protein